MVSKTKKIKKLSNSSSCSASLKKSWPLMVLQQGTQVLPQDLLQHLDLLAVVLMVLAVLLVAGMKCLLLLLEWE